jgi:hypothetical protein
MEPSTMTLKEAQQSLHQNIAAISVEFHLHPLFDQFSDIIGPQVNGFPGIYTLCVQMAEVLTDWEFRSGAGTAIYDTLGIGWIDLVEDYVAAMLRSCLESRMLIPPAVVFERLDTTALVQRRANRMNPPLACAVFTIADADRLMGLADEFLEGWAEDAVQSGKPDPEYNARIDEWQVIRPLLVQAPALLAAVQAHERAELETDPTLRREKLHHARDLREAVLQALQADQPETPGAIDGHQL